MFEKYEKNNIQIHVLKVFLGNLTLTPANPPPPPKKKNIYVSDWLF